MATEAQLRAIKKWSAEKVDEIKIRVPKGQKAEIQAFAKAHGETVNAFVNRLIRDAMTAEKNGTYSQRRTAQALPWRRHRFEYAVG